MTTQYPSRPMPSADGLELTSDTLYSIVSRNFGMTVAEVAGLFPPFQYEKVQSLLSELYKTKRVDMGWRDVGPNHYVTVYKRRSYHSNY